MPVSIKEMPKSSRSFALFLCVLAVISAGYLLGVPAVPFHPDESTQLYNSADVEAFWQHPAALFWQADKENDPRQAYRELDAPLPRNLIALGRWIAGQPLLPTDWNWGKTWAENEAAGALPSPALLLAGRMALAALFPFSVLFLFLTARRVSNDFTAWVAALLLASNALVLMHTRRAMAEGPLLFTCALTMWSLVKAEKRPWLTALPAALAFCAKQSLAALDPAGLLAALWPAPEPSAIDGRPQRPGWFVRALLYGVLLAAIIFALNPFLWQQPVPAARAALQARSDLAAAQTADRPEQALNNPGRKLIGLIGGLYMTPPIFAETANYVDDTRLAENAYLANPLNSLFRSVAGGAVMLIVTLFGFFLACREAFHAAPANRRRLILLLAATLAQALALLALVPLPWQRYYLPLVPFTCLWAAFGINRLREAASQAVRRAKQPALASTTGREQ